MKDKKFIFIVYIFIMILVFIVSTTNLVIDENFKKVYDISIILDDADSSKYKKLIMGIEDSTFDFVVDINIVFLENANDIEEQKKAIMNEVNSGVDGIIIAPVNSDAIDTFIDESNIKVPIISLDKEMKSRKVSGVVKADYVEIGEKLGKNIYNLESGKDIVAFVETGYLNNDLYSALQKTLETHGSSCSIVYYNDNNFVEKVEAYDMDNTVFVSISPETTEEFINKFIENKDYSKNLRLYGVGYRNEFLYYLNNGEIQALSLYDEYLMGYLSVQNLICAIEGEDFNKETIIPNYIVNKYDVYKYEKILFPRD